MSVMELEATMPLAHLPDSDRLLKMPEIYRLLEPLGAPTQRQVHRWIFIIEDEIGLVRAVNKGGRHKIPQWGVKRLAVCAELIHYRVHPSAVFEWDPLTRERVLSALKGIVAPPRMYKNGDHQIRRWGNP